VNEVVASAHGESKQMIPNERALNPDLKPDLSRETPSDSIRELHFCCIAAISTARVQILVMSRT